MAIGITVVNDTNHTASCTKTIISRQAELGEVLTVTVPVALYSTYPKAYINFIQGDGKAYVIDNNNAAFDYAAGTFTYTLGSADTMFSVDGTLGIQIVLRDVAPPNTLKEWRSRIVNVTVEGSIVASMDSVSGIIEAIGQAMLPANRVSLTDSNNRYTSTQVEGALAEIAGSGRTTETVKGTYDYAVNVNGDLTAHISDTVAHMDAGEQAKLAGIEAGAEVNNISDVNAIDLTNGGDTTLHIHDSRYYTETEMNGLLAGKIDLNGLNSDIDELHFDITPTSVDALLEGQLRWNATDKTLDIGMDGSGIVQQVGMETYYPRCHNNSGVQINNGQLVMYNGALGNSGTILIAPASTTMALPGLAMGVATENIPNGQDGRVTWFGLVRGIQTDGVNYGEVWTDGQIIYNSSTIAGGLSKTKPVAPKSAVMAGVVVNAHGSNGILFIRPQYFPFVSHLSDVKILNPLNGDVLTYVSATGTWENKPSTAGTTLAGLSDVGVVAPSDDQFLRFDNISGKWINETVTFSSSLDGLSDVTVTAPADKQLLTYDNGQWINKDAPSGGQYYGTAEVKAISYNARSIAENIAIPANASCMSVGPITVETGYTVTTGDNSRWVIL